MGNRLFFLLYDLALVLAFVLAFAANKFRTAWRARH